MYSYRRIVVMYVLCWLDDTLWFVFSVLISFANTWFHSSGFTYEWLNEYIHRILVSLLFFFRIVYL